MAPETRRKRSDSGLCSDMHRGNATGQIVELDIDKSRILHHRLETLTIRKFHNGIRKILVGAALGDQTAQPWQYAQKVEVIHSTEEAVERGRKFEDHRPAARLEDAAHLTETFLTIDNIADTKSDRNAVEDRVRMRHRFAGRIDHQDSI